MTMQLQIIPTGLLEQYKHAFPENARNNFDDLTESKLSTATFDFYTSVSAVFSSKIEGEEIDLDSFIKHKKVGVQYQPEHTQKIDDLYDAYIFAQGNQLDELGVHYVHSLLTKNILQETHQGKYRQNSMYVIAKNGDIDYVAAEPERIVIEMAKFYHDIKTLLNENLSFEELLYFASMIHLVFVKIHPYEDGNGRTARLLEKWFLAQKLGEKAWYLQSEKYYFDNHQMYYANIRRMGIEYIELNYDEALPFAMMLPKAVC
ncbi:MAG: Fic family protein [Flavobacterium sp.]